MLVLCRLLCFSLWSDVTHMTHMHRDTKTTFTPRDYQSPGTNRTGHNSPGGSRRWPGAPGRVLSGKDGRAARVRTWLNNTNASSYSLKSVDERTKNLVRKSISPDGAVGFPAPAVMETRDGGYSHLKSSLRHKRGHRGQKLICTQERDTVGRHRRNAKDGERKESIGQPTPLSSTPEDAWEPLPKPLAQNQSIDFPFDMTSDYEQFTSPDLEDSTPFVPINTRPRRKEVKNPFFPVTAESYGAYAILIISAIIFTVGIIGNIAIMCIVCHNYYMRSISNSLLANLALWDFVVIFFCLPLVIFHELTKDWLLGEFSCKIIPYLEVASLGVTTFTLCALCIDRFRAATNVQMYYEMIENCASTGAKLAVIWVGALLLALPELLIRQLVTEDGEPPDVAPCERCVVRISTQLPDTLYVLGLTYDGARLWWYFGCYFCLPTLFTIGCSLATARKIRQAERTSVRGNKKQIQLESQMNCTVVALAILYGFCIIPENICNIVSVYMAAGVPRRTLDILHLVSQLLLFCKSAVTPVLLFCLCQPFSRAFLDCCCCCCQECGPPRSSTTATTSDNDNDQEGGATELEMSACSTARRQASASPYAAVGTHC